MKDSYIIKNQRKNFMNAYRLHSEQQQKNKNTIVKKIRLTFSPNFYRNHSDLIDDWTDNCNRALNPREYGINYLQPANYPNMFDGLILIPNKRHWENLLLSNDSEILGEAQIVMALYNEKETLQIEITKETDPTNLTDVEIKTLKIKHNPPKYYTEVTL
jgi:hypothetical protein